MGSQGRLGRGRMSHDFNYNLQHMIPALDFLTITRKSHFCGIVSAMLLALLSGVFPLTRSKRNDGSRDLVYFSPNLMSLVCNKPHI